MTLARLVRRISGSVNSGRPSKSSSRVEPDRDAVGHAPAAAGALVGGGLADRLDRQPLHLGAHGVAADPRDAGVDDVRDAGHRQRRLGDVGGQHDAAHRGRVAGEDLVLVGRAEAGVERDDLEPVALERVERVGGVADLALAGQEDQHVARALGRQLAHGVDDRLGLVALDRLAVLVVLRQLEQGAVADLDGIRTTRHLDHGRVEVRGEAVDVDRRAGDDHLEVGPARQQALEVAEQEVDVEAALVGLVDDDRVVLAEVAVALQLGEQDAVGHQLDPAGLRRAVGEADLVADDVAELGAELLGDPLGHRARGDPARLGVADQLAALGRAEPAAELEADLRQLGGLPRPGLAGHDHDLVVADGRSDVVAACGDRELGGIGDLHNGGHSRPRRQPGLQRSPVGRGSLNLSGRHGPTVQRMPQHVRSWSPRPRRAAWSAGAGRVRRAGRRACRRDRGPRSSASRCCIQPPRSRPPSSPMAWTAAKPRPPTMMPASADAMSAASP